jgi:YHS domain-containing protein
VAPEWIERRGIDSADHPPIDAEEHSMDQHGGHGQLPMAGGDGTAIDPVCGMTVQIATARGKDLHFSHDQVDYYFCGRGCKLEFGDDPGTYLAAGYVPSM